MEVLQHRGLLHGHKLSLQTIIIDKTVVVDFVDTCKPTRLRMLSSLVGEPSQMVCLVWSGGPEIHPEEVRRV